MKYCFCWQVERIVEDRGIGPSGVTIEDEEGRTVVACGPWRDSKEDADRDGILYRSDREAFFRLLDRKEG
jgi:hypothetical protein